VIFEISDSGRGIDAALMPKLFTAFEQGTRSGEGLAWAWRSARRSWKCSGKNQGRKQIGGQGAVFTVELKTVPALSVIAPVQRNLPLFRPGS